MENVNGSCINDMWIIGVQSVSADDKKTLKVAMECGYAPYNWTQPDKNICGEDAAMYMIPGTFPYAMQIYPYANPLGYQAANALVISANCEYPERAMELIEFMTSDEGARLVRTGVPGEDWDVVDGEPELIGKRLENFTSMIKSILAIQLTVYRELASINGYHLYGKPISVQMENR